MQQAVAFHSSQKLISAILQEVGKGMAHVDKQTNCLDQFGGYPQYPWQHTRHARDESISSDSSAHQQQRDHIAW